LPLRENELPQLLLEAGRTNSYCGLGWMDSTERIFVLLFHFFGHGERLQELQNKLQTMLNNGSPILA
jgi:hypothetical protein